MNYGELKTHIRGECVVEFDDTLFDRWTEIVDGWLRRAAIINDRIVTGTVVEPVSSPFLLTSGGQNVEEITALWYEDGDQQIPIPPSSPELVSRWKGQTSTKPVYYRRIGQAVDVSPFQSGLTYGFIATIQDSLMEDNSDQSTALWKSPGLVVAAYLRLAHRHNQDEPNAIIADADYDRELGEHREHESSKTAGAAAQSSGAWTWA